MSEQQNFNWKKQIKWPAFGICVGFLVLFIIASLINKEVTYSVINTCFTIVGNYFGGAVQVLMFVFWVALLAIAFSKWGNIRIGGKDAKKNTTNLSWYAVITTTLLAGGGIFFSAAEPLVHFMTLPPHFSGVTSATAEATSYALAQTYVDWGFLVWGVSALGVPLLVYAHEVKKLPMRPSSMLYPVLGKRGSCGPVGIAMDGFSLIGVAAGTIGPTGFLGLQIAYTLHNVFGVTDSTALEICIILVATVIFTIGASTGANNGMTMLARWTIYLGVFMMAIFLIFGNCLFVVDSFFDGLGTYMNEFLNLTFTRDDPAWLNSWTIFYLVWFLSFGPSMSVLIINLSKGRTLRQVLTSIALIAPIITMIWFTIFGATGIEMELKTPGLISTALSEYGMPSVLITIIQNMPFSSVLIPIAIILVILFLVTTGAGVAYSMAVQVTNMETPYAWVRALFGILLGVGAAILVWIGGSDAMNALQNFMVVCGIPMLFFYVIVLIGLPKAAKALYRSKRHRIDIDDRFIEELPIESETDS